MVEADGLPGTDWTPVTKRPITVEARLIEDRCEIATREGTIVGDPGDVLIRGVEDELYPCDPDIFRESYVLGGRADQKTIDEVYTDRNALAVAFARMVGIHRRLLDTIPPNFRGPKADGFSAWYDLPDADDADADEWAIVYAELPTGQVSWHVPRELVEDSRVPFISGVEWDGHDRSTKNTRLREFASVL